MNKEFIILLFVAGIIGSLGGTFLTTSLLDEIYAYHIDIQTLPVLCCALLIITVGLSTTSYTIMLAAKANPVETLRNE
jgi:ABC-type antimicrobial peptide transport system permease subunit